MGIASAAQTPIKLTKMIAPNPRYCPATIRRVEIPRAKKRVSRNASSTLVAANVVMLAVSNAR
jgi:hypothetical protein